MEQYMFMDSSSDGKGNTDSDWFEGIVAQRRNVTYFKNLDIIGFC